MKGNIHSTFIGCNPASATLVYRQVAAMGVSHRQDGCPVVNVQGSPQPHRFRGSWEHVRGWPRAVYRGGAGVMSGAIGGGRCCPLQRESTICC